MSQILINRSLITQMRIGISEGWEKGGKVETIFRYCVDNGRKVADSWLYLSNDIPFRRDYLQRSSCKVALEFLTRRCVRKRQREWSGAVRECIPCRCAINGNAISRSWEYPIVLYWWGLLPERPELSAIGGWKGDWMDAGWCVLPLGRHRRQCQSRTYSWDALHVVHWFAQERTHRPREREDLRYLGKKNIACSSHWLINHIARKIRYGCKIFFYRCNTLSKKILCRFNQRDKTGRRGKMAMTGKKVIFL